MSKYLLRTLRQVCVFELLGKEKIVDADTESSLHLAARKFLVEEFPGESGLGPDPSIEVEIKKIGDEKPVTARQFPAGMEPKNRAGTGPGAPF